MGRGLGPECHVDPILALVLPRLTLGLQGPVVKGGANLLVDQRRPSLAPVLPGQEAVPVMPLGVLRIDIVFVG